MPRIASALGTLLSALALLTSCHSLREGESGRVAESAYVTLGAIEQWVTVRGASRSAPVLLLIHGGPGDTQSSFVFDYAAYEKHFVLVQWDQRGSGRTFLKLGERTPDLGFDRLVQDGIELAQHLHARFPRNALVVMGHSWGSAIATEMVRRRPDLFAAYVGTGQIASWSESVQWQFDFLKRKAKEANDAAMLASLEAIGTPDPTNAAQYFGFTRPLRRFLGEKDAGWLARLNAYAQAPERQNDADFKAALGGMDFSSRALLPAQMAERLSTEALQFALPYIVIQGEQDVFTPTPPAVRYFDAVSAPRKRLVVLPDAGHFALVTDAEAFSRVLASTLEEWRVD